MVDLGFGDGGKGLITDFLTRRVNAGVNVRFNGGAQAGHNVVTADGRHHTFAQFGAGSFLPKVRTFLSRFMVVHPTALLLEAAALRAAGAQDILSRTAISENALLVTPYHQAAGRLRELLRGNLRHGSCGVGIGETVKSSIEFPGDAVRAGDLRDTRRLGDKLARVRDRLYGDIQKSPRINSETARYEYAIFENKETASLWIENCAPAIPLISPDTTLKDWLSRTNAAIFEGAQGLLIDESLGFHPNTSWSCCTAQNARELLAESARNVPLNVWGVLRAYSVRHGPGPFPSECEELKSIIVEHNGINFWQGAVRYGWFDTVLSRYALALSGTLDAIVMTHVDALSRRTDWAVCTGYESPGKDRTFEIEAETKPSLERQERLGQFLSKCFPVLETAPSDEAGYLKKIEEYLGRKIDAVSRGPKAADVELRSELRLN